MRGKESRARDKKRGRINNPKPEPRSRALTYPGHESDQFPRQIHFRRPAENHRGRPTPPRGIENLPWFPKLSGIVLLKDGMMWYWAVGETAFKPSI